LGQKVNPIGIRLGIVKTWESRWFGGKNYAQYILEDHKLRTFIKKKLEIFIDIQEVRKPEIEAQLVAENVALQIVRRVAFRRAMKRGVSSAMRFGALGVKIICSGRLGGAEMARTEWYREGRVPLHTLRADIDYGITEARTTYGIVGVKVFIFKGEILKKDQMEQE
jgi:small subunit ribosomal protein S3